MVDHEHAACVAIRAEARASRPLGASFPLRASLARLALRPGRTPLADLALGAWRTCRTTWPGGHVDRHGLGRNRVACAESGGEEEAGGGGEHQAETEQDLRPAPHWFPHSRLIS